MAAGPLCSRPFSGAEHDQNLQRLGDVVKPVRFERRDEETHARRYFNSLSASGELGLPSQHVVDLVFFVRLLGVSGADCQTIDAKAEIA
jgi:hypothetical protein